MCVDFISPMGKMKTFIIIAVAFFASSLADAVPTHSTLTQCGNLPLSPELESSADLVAPAKIGRIIKGHNLIWGESIGWVNLKVKNADVKLGSNILAGWVWIENCGWVCLGEGHPLKVGHYSNRGAYDWGVNNDGRGNLSGFAWSEVTGWINFQTSHSRVYLDKSGQFYGYAWGENVGWMHFGPGSTVQYLAKADPGPWKEIGQEPGSRFAGGHDNSEMSSGSVPLAGLKSNHKRYDGDADSACSLRVGRDDFCAHIRRCDTPVNISDLAKLAPIRAPPVIA